jgi:hypothetical protein
MDHPTSDSDARPHQVTYWLERLQAGDTSALDQIVPLVYNELRARRGIVRDMQGSCLSIQSCRDKPGRIWT